MDLLTYILCKKLQSSGGGGGSQPTILLAGTGTGSIESLLAKTPKLTDTNDIYNPLTTTFDIESVVKGLMNPFGGALANNEGEGGQVVFGLGNTGLGRNCFIAGTRNYVNANESAAIGQGNYNTAKYSLAGGGNNLLQGGSYLFVYGSKNKINSNSNNNSFAVFGTSNDIQNVQCSLVGGRLNIAIDAYDSLVFGRYNYLKSKGNNDGNIILGSFFNKSSSTVISQAEAIGARNISIGYYNKINANIDSAVLIGHGLNGTLSQAIFGTYNEIHEGYSIIFANGVNGDNRHNVFMLPKYGTNNPTAVLDSNLKINNGFALDASIETKDGTISAKSISATGSISGNIIQNSVFKADASTKQMSIFSGQTLSVGGTLTISGKANFMSNGSHDQFKFYKYYAKNEEAGTPTYSNKVSITGEEIKISSELSSDKDITSITRKEIVSPKFIGNLQGIANNAIADKNGDDIVNTYVKNTNYEEWTFTLEDGSIVTKKVVVIE